MGVFNGAFNKNQTGQLLNKAARQGQQLLPLLRHPLGPLLKIENPKIHRGFLSSFFIIFPKKNDYNLEDTPKTHRVDHQFPF